MESLGTIKPNPLSSLETLRHMAEAIAAGMTPLADLSAEDALRRLHALRESTAILGQIDAALVQRIYLAGEHGDVRLEGLPAAKVQRGRDRKEWDGRGAAFAYFEARMREREGEMPDPAEVVDWVLEVVGVSYCRVTPLRAHGLDAKEFCTETPGRIAVTFS